MNVAREEKNRTDKIEGDLLMVKDHCENQMMKQSHEESVVQAKIDAVMERSRTARELSKNQKETVKGMIKEIHSELDQCSS